MSRTRCDRSWLKQHLTHVITGLRNEAPRLARCARGRWQHARGGATTAPDAVGPASSAAGARAPAGRSDIRTTMARAAAETRGLAFDRMRAPALERARASGVGRACSDQRRGWLLARRDRVSPFVWLAPRRASALRTP